MNVHTCTRCDGSGHVTGRHGWEIPWTKWATDPKNPSNYAQVLQPRACTDCGGTGVLLELDAQPDPAAGLPYRPYRPNYRNRVAHLIARR